MCIRDSPGGIHLEATVKVLRACGARVIVPRAQHCCGLPMVDAGDARSARVLARQTITILEMQADYIVSAANSCVAAIVHDYPHLFRDEPEWNARALRLAERVMDLATFLTRVATLPPGALVGRSSVASAVTYHAFCQTLNLLHADGAARWLLREGCGIDLLELPEANVCCGSGARSPLTRPR